MARRLALLGLLALALAAAGCGGEETVAPTPETVEGTLEQPEELEGNPEAGQAVFADVAEPPCGQCHTLSAAGTEAEIGPSLDEALAGDSPEQIRDSIVNPSAEVTEGFQDIMPKDYGEQLSDQQLADLVAFLEQAAGS